MTKTEIKNKIATQALLLAGVVSTAVVFIYLVTVHIEGCNSSTCGVGYIWLLILGVVATFISIPIAYLNARIALQITGIKGMFGVNDNSSLQVTEWRYFAALVLVLVVNGLLSYYLLDSYIFKQDF